MNRDEMSVIVRTAYSVASYAGLTHVEWLEHREDIVHEAIVGYLEGERDVKSARNNAMRYVRKQVRKAGFVGGHGDVRVTYVQTDRSAQPLNPTASVSLEITLGQVLRLARKLYRRGKIRGKRARRSAALKSLILRDRAYGLDYETIAERYHITSDNAKKHAQVAKALLEKV